MKREAKVHARALCILLSALVLPLLIAAQAALPSQLANWGLSDGPRESASEATPTVADDIWGPEVGLPSTGETTGLAPLPIGADQVSANSTIVSDDFNACALDTDVWTVVDPVGDCSYEMVGTFTDNAWLSISVPGGSDHDIWEEGNLAPRVMQTVSDVDFEVEVKFESGVSQKYQMQGVLVEQDEDHFLRLEFHSDGSGTRLFAASLEPDPSPPPPLTYTAYYNQAIAEAGVAPLYMRVQREGDEWTLYWSDDGVNWTSAVTFAHALTVTKIGAYAANADSSPPAHTGYIDYFFNTASPIDPEDGERNTLTVDIAGSGSVDVDPVKSNYDCGDEVTLTANAGPGCTFAGWNGDLTGTENPATITMDGSKNVVANFGHRVLLPLVSKAPFTNYRFVGDFETGDLTGFYWLANKPEVVASSDPVRAGNYSLESYLNRDESPSSYRTEVVTCREDDMPEGTHKPMELSNTGGYASEYWIGFSIYIPSDFVIDVDGRSDIVFQLHGKPDEGEEYRNPLLALEIDADEWQIVSRWDDRRIMPGPPFDYRGAHEYVTPLGDSIGRWTDWVIQTRLSYEASGDGFLRVWKDGELWFDQEGPNCYNDDKGPHPSMGVYKWAWREEYDHDTNPDWRRFYHDELRIAGADGSYGIVAP